MYKGEISQNNETLDFYNTWIIVLPTPVFLIMHSHSSRSVNVEESILKFIYVHA